MQPTKKKKKKRRIVYPREIEMIEDQKKIIDSVDDVSVFRCFKPYMNRDVASPLPPSGLRSLLAVYVPLMHSHSLACSCKTSRDLSKFFPLLHKSVYWHCWYSSLLISSSGASNWHALLAALYENNHHDTSRFYYISSL